MEAEVLAVKGAVVEAGPSHAGGKGTLVAAWAGQKGCGDWRPEHEE